MDPFPKVREVGIGRREGLVKSIPPHVGCGVLDPLPKTDAKATRLRVPSERFWMDGIHSPKVPLGVQALALDRIERPADSVRRFRADHGIQVRLTPFDRLNPAATQMPGVSRNHSW